MLLEAYQNQKLSFLSDQDARPQSSANPRAHLWDNGSSAAKELEHVLKVRAIALNNIGENTIKEGRPMAEIEEALAPIYFYHRYQVEAAVKVIGGLHYSYAVKGDGQVPTELVSPEEQKEALQAVLTTLDAKTLTLPESLLEQIPPRPLGYYRTRENIKSNTGLTFDPIGAAESSAEMTVSLLLNPARANRLVEHNARDKAQPSLGYVLDELIKSTIWMPREKGLNQEIQRAVVGVVLNKIMALSVSNLAHVQTKAITQLTLKNLQTDFKNSAKTETSINEKAFLSYMANTLVLYFKNPSEWQHQEALPLPDGSPIGSSLSCTQND
ncbi:hypothetical protein MNBD_BACTEROID06-1113 [hydrothermal vent metagenome]|uniref:EcxA zinc-binding domain-containing protein n=1 Tax=hydrothermal vent metagenome TaxID=652676 RepID=A0A3B0UEG0_9ZZZZ